MTHVKTSTLATLSRGQVGHLDKTSNPTGHGLLLIFLVADIWDATLLAGKPPPGFGCRVSNALKIARSPLFTSTVTL